ncbi:MAG: sugar phosphate isomerase/epimerase [Actinobacteria bacterium]|nr:sugar phosphate isomerase/epimerase [Actinomycetota bacterium]
MNIKIDTHIFCLGTFAERYVPGGYTDKMDFEKRIETIGKIKGIKGISTTYPGFGMDNPDKYVKLLSNNGLKVSNLSIDTWADLKWKYGSFSCSDKRVRKETIRLFKEGTEIAKHLKASSVLIWPAHDGFDYPFQVDYGNGWDTLINTIKEIGEHDRSVNFAVEYKSKDPRQKQYVSNIGKIMMLLDKVGLKNVGGALDIGHALMAQENLAESLVILDRSKKLFQIHLNDNYKDADPDLVFGTISFWEILEFFYYLNKTDYDGWLTIDVVSPRDDPKRTLEISVKLIDDYLKISRKLVEHEKEISFNLSSQNFIENLEIIRKVLF